MLPPEIASERLRPLRRAEYDRLVELGVFGDERVELLRGVLVEMSPQGSLHAEVVSRLTKMFVRALGDRAEVRIQLPFAATDESEPEPDIAVVPPGNYADAHPAAALLIIEVADSSRRRDRVIKSEVYAEAVVPEYWIVDLEESLVEVHTAPKKRRYTSLATCGRGDTLRPTAFPDVAIRVGDLLP